MITKNNDEYSKIKRTIIDENGNSYECNILKFPDKKEVPCNSYPDMSSSGKGRRKTVTRPEEIYGEIQIIDKDAIKIIECSMHNSDIKLYIEMTAVERLMCNKDRLQIDFVEGPEFTQKDNVWKFRYIK